MAARIQGKHHFEPAKVGSLPAEADPTGPPYCKVCQQPQANSRHTMPTYDDLLFFIRLWANCTKDGEPNPDDRAGAAYEMSNKAAWDFTHEVISDARTLLDLPFRTDDLTPRK